MCKDVVDVGDVHVDVHVCVQIAVEEVTVGADVDVVDIAGKCEKLRCFKGRVCLSRLFVASVCRVCLSHLFVASVCPSVCPSRCTTHHRKTYCPGALYPCCRVLNKLSKVLIVLSPTTEVSPQF